ncbi:hydrolase activity protein [[Candida] boidinii]|nr:hydrolase activity protein [[Candida] boidinii]
MENRDIDQELREEEELINSSSTSLLRRAHSSSNNQDNNTNLEFIKSISMSNSNNDTGVSDITVNESAISTSNFYNNNGSNINNINSNIQSSEIEPLLPSTQLNNKTITNLDLLSIKNIDNLKISDVSILDYETLKNLQKLSEYEAKNLNFFKIIKLIYKFLIKNDTFSIMEKIVLNLEPNDCSLISKYSNLEEFNIKNDKIKNISKIIMSTINIEHPLRVYNERNNKQITNDNDSEREETIKLFIDKLDSLPVVIFIHGLGGQISQFEPIIALLSQCSDIFGFELPGCGNSKPINKSINFYRLSKIENEKYKEMIDIINDLNWQDFNTNSISELLSSVIMQKFPNRKLIIIGHSMGTHISIKLINKLPKEKIEMFIMLSPPKIIKDDNIPNALPKDLATRTLLSIFNYFPKLFDFYRYFDRLNGLNGLPLKRAIYESDNIELKNPINFASSIVEHDNEQEEQEQEQEENDDNNIGNHKNTHHHYINSNNEDEHLLFRKLRQFRWNLDTNSSIFLRHLSGFQLCTEEELIECCSNIKDSLNSFRILIICGENDKLTPIGNSENIYNKLNDLNFKVKFKKLSNTNHSLFLDKPELTSAIILEFIDNIKELNINIPWVLKIKAKINGDKWGLKNEIKWQKIKSISSILINPTTKEISPLLGMKTLRETDEVHNPKKFEKSHPEIKYIVDIGSNLPSYDPKNFQRIKYIKFSTVSKIIPDNITIRKFISLINELQNGLIKDKEFIVIHCHYGFNRTGFLICSYLIEKLGWSVSDAIESFKIAKEPGIKHPHFIDGLYLRYENN